MAEDGLVFNGSFTYSWDDLFRDDEDVGGCLRGNVSKGTAEIVLIEDVSGDPALVDFLKKSFHGEVKLADGGQSSNPNAKRRGIR